MGEVAVEFEAAPTWAPEHQREAHADWQAVDHALRTIAQRRAALDADEAHWLREAEALPIWRPLGMVSALDYLERVLGYGPRAAQERLRVARSLGMLPQLTAALAHGGLPYSAVRELTRVATPVTEASWVAAATGKNLRQIEELVADHRPGDYPEDPPDPEARVRAVRFELSAETFALLRQARAVLDDEHGSHLSDDPLVASLSRAVLDGVPATEPTGRAKFQIAVTVCERCRQGWQDGAGAKIAISPAAVERATCDAQHIGSLDGTTPERAYQDVPPSVARLVWRRDGGRCRVPGCRSARGIELHHLIHRADGGGHDASDLALLCSSCHLAHHRDALTITGTADHLEVRRSTEPSAAGAHVGAPVHPNAHVDAPVHRNAHVDAPVHGNAHVHACADGNHHVDAVANDSAHVDAPVHRNAHVDAVADGNHHVDAVANGNAHVGAPTKLDATIVRTQAKSALIRLGWKPAIAQAAVAAALAALSAEAPLERLIFEALRRCSRPTS